MRKLASSLLVALALVVPMLQAPAADAAVSLRVWNRLAQCESGGRWHIATGNGYYGGVQISASTWRGYGGRRYAALPHRATKGEQITIARRIKQAQGWRAWPSCSRRIGVR